MTFRPNALSLGLLASSGANLIVPAGVSSRWKSSRVIDYVVTSCASPNESLTMCEERWSDHRGFLCSLTTDALDGFQERCELVPCLTYLPKELERLPGGLPCWTAWNASQPERVEWCARWQHVVASVKSSQGPAAGIAHAAVQKIKTATP